MFEDVLIESAPHKGAGKKALTLPISILIHGLVIGVALGASIWFVEDIPEPPIPVTFYASAPPPPPPPPAAAPKPAAAKPETPKPVPVKPAEMTAPTVIPEKIPEPLAVPEVDLPEGEGVEGGLREACPEASRGAWSEGWSGVRDPAPGTSPCAWAATSSPRN